MHFTQMVVEGEIGELPSDIYKGLLNVDGVKFDDLVPINFEAQAPLSITMAMREDGRELIIRGTTLNRSC